MRRLLTVIAASALLLGLVVPGGVASAKGNAPADRGNERGSSAITLYSVETATVNISPSGRVDPPEDDPAGFGPGARFQSVDLLYRDEGRTRQVGRNDISCLVTQVTGDEQTGAATLLCQGVVRLNGQGSLSWQGSITFQAAAMEEGDEFGVVAITGGTGRFVAAGGQIVLFDESGDGSQSLSRYEIELVRPTGKG